MDSAADRLQAIRSRIDAIDEEMHRLLIDRSGVIDELIRVKGTSKPGAAFRPDREADMMRRIVVRHSGNFPLVTVEHIWREIITTFTAMQAPFGVTAGPAEDPLAMRDLVRFYFGFSVPVQTSESAEAALARVAGGNELAVISAGTPGRWWAPLCEPDGPKIFAKLPFIEYPERAAAIPAYVIGPALQDASPPDIRLVAATGAGETDEALLALGGIVAGRSGGERLIELPVSATDEDLLRTCEFPPGSLRNCGGFAQPIRILATKGD